ncbi:transcriptional regulator, LysR family [Kandleria vitulina DSM 20405]|jgi:DNA-binding transcriptional LysR family regulator|uniref:Transcriptional regulator, LysR family n=1 Tax=Kandleria vitulina DSM 20405 TaxID=1410657 RepID=A0A0R2HED7_9FIRM|nr:LysR family transcriptional regulator [Kandleria vitulina]KRN51433.1 transcriptional regulator, LysR family [Kandleria vitulina DSM 20405]MEE0988334.1 LysR family transcriptional regulator [Kandleria vitulina]SEJ27949.1 transcriptional regulator, LysR family [Kandleria vitulina]
MELKQMRYYKTIVEEGTISQAAKKLHMAQPPLSVQLKSIEQELGLELIIRGRRQVSLTDAGKLFYRRCVQVLSLVDLSMKEMTDVMKQTLRIGITSSNSALIQQKHIVKFMKEHPSLNVRIKEGPTSEMKDLILAHDIDVGIVRTPFDANNVQTFYMKKDPMVAVGPADVVNDSMDHMADYKSLPLIVHRRYRSLIADYCLNSMQFYPNIHIQSDDCRTSLIWAETLGGVAIIPRTALTFVHKDLKTVTLKDKELYTSVALITRKDEVLSPIAQEFLDLFKERY